jgi:hypothetical protein
MSIFTKKKGQGALALELGGIAAYIAFQQRRAGLHPQRSTGKYQRAARPFFCVWNS